MQTIHQTTIRTTHQVIMRTKMQTATHQIAMQTKMQTTHQAIKQAKTQATHQAINTKQKKRNLSGSFFMFLTVSFLPLNIENIS